MDSSYLQNYSNLIFSLWFIKSFVAFEWKVLSFNQLWPKNSKLTYLDRLPLKVQPSPLTELAWDSKEHQDNAPNLMHSIFNECDHPCEMNSQKPGNSQEFLENPRNSNLLPDMQINKIEKPWNFWEYLGISENTYGNLWEFHLWRWTVIGICGNNYLGTQKDIKIIYRNSWEFPEIPENLSQFGLTTNFKFNSHKGLFPIKVCTLNEFT